MNILIFSPGYPDSKKSVYPFVKQLVDEWGRQGHHCTVVACYSITNTKSFTKFKTEQTFESGGKVTVYRPNVLTFSNIKIFGFSLTKYFHDQGIRRALKYLKEKQDAVYCHFWESGNDGYLYTKKNGIPMFVATGESDIKRMLGDTKLPFLDIVKGVVCVSTKNKKESIHLGLTTAAQCEIIPNAINPRVFRKLDKSECRKRLGISSDMFVIAFVGAYKTNKGADRLSEAIKLIPGQAVYSFFIGSGSVAPSAPNMLFDGRLLQQDIPVYLNAADVFVLPTLAEGCCNAIIEAMACGLPIISSNLSFNWDVLNDKNSILIDPNNVKQIADAIQLLRDCPELRFKMSEEALKTARELTIDKRAMRIIEFINNKISNN